LLPSDPGLFNGDVLKKVHIIIDFGSDK